MYLRHERVQNPHTMSSVHKGIHEVRANKTGATSYQYVSFSQKQIPPARSVPCVVSSRLL